MGGLVPADSTWESLWHSLRRVKLKNKSIGTPNSPPGDPSSDAGNLTSPTAPFYTSAPCPHSCYSLEPQQWDHQCSPSSPRADFGHLCRAPKKPRPQQHWERPALHGREGGVVASFYASVSRCKPDCKRKKLVTIIIIVPGCGSLIEICHFGRINAAGRDL